MMKKKVSGLKKAEHMTEESDFEDPETGEIARVLDKHH